MCSSPFSDGCQDGAFWRRQMRFVQISSHAISPDMHCEGTLQLALQLWMISSATEQFLRVSECERVDLSLLIQARTVVAICRSAAD